MCQCHEGGYLFGGFEYELTEGDPRLGSSRAYEPSSFFRIRYTTNITQRMAQSSPTTAPMITAEIKEIKKVHEEESVY